MRWRCKPIPSQGELLALFTYEPESGKLFWRVNRTGGTYAGDEAGTTNTEGYLRVKIKGTFYQVHRIIYAMQTGVAPDRVDHKDGNRKNNAWSNLRPATGQQNVFNQKLRANNTTGFKGVSRRGRKFVACITARGRQVTLGTFDDPALAHEVWCLAADLLHGEFANHG